MTLNMVRSKKAHRPDCRYVKGSTLGIKWEWPDNSGFESYEDVAAHLRELNEQTPGAYVEPCGHCLPAPE